MARSGTCSSDRASELGKATFAGSVGKSLSTLCALRRSSAALTALMRSLSVKPSRAATETLHVRFRLDRCKEWPRRPPSSPHLLAHGVGNGRAPSDAAGAELLALFAPTTRPAGRNRAHEDLGSGAPSHVRPRYHTSARWNPAAMLPLQSAGRSSSNPANQRSKDAPKVIARTATSAGGWADSSAPGRCR